MKELCELQMSKLWHAATVVISFCLWLAILAEPLSASSTWGATWGGYLGSHPLSIWGIDSDSGSVSERMRIPGANSRTGVLDFASDPFRNPSIVWSLHQTEQNGYELISFSPYQQLVLSNVSLDASLELSGLAIDPTTGVMYGTSKTALYSIQPSDGEAVIVGLTNHEVAWALGFDVEGSLFGVGVSERRLISIDKASGATTSVGEMDAWPADIAMRPEDGLMYGLGHSGIAAYTYGLYTIDIDTAALSHVGPSLGRPAGLAFTNIPEPNTLTLSLLAITGFACRCCLQARVA